MAKIPITQKNISGFPGFHHPKSPALLLYLSKVRYIPQYKHKCKAGRKSQRLCKRCLNISYLERSAWKQQLYLGTSCCFVRKHTAFLFCFLTEEAVVICLKACSGQQKTEYLVYSFHHNTKHLVFLTSDVMLTSSTSKCTSTSHDTCLTKHKMVCLLWFKLVSVVPRPCRLVFSWLVRSSPSLTISWRLSWTRTEPGPEPGPELRDYLRPLFFLAED